MADEDGRGVNDHRSVCVSSKSGYRGLALRKQGYSYPEGTMRKTVVGVLAAGLLFTIAVTSDADSARAEDCPGTPDALGTSRVLLVDPGQYPRIGAMDHAAELPLSMRSENTQLTSLGTSP
jgi:hypothetical protein